MASLLWHAGAAFVGWLGGLWLARGSRGRCSEVVLRLSALAALAIAGLGLLALFALILWSLAGIWRFPDALPSTWSLAPWHGLLNSLALPFANSLIIAFAATIGGLGFALAWFECDDRQGRIWTPSVLRFAYLPLFPPQIAFVFGIQIPLLWLGLDGTRFAVAWAHFLFVFPYMMITLVEPWRALDPRLARAARSLGASPRRIFLTLKLPLLLRPILVACAVGFAVSFTQYLPSLFVGAGRVPTLTTEAVALASGADRRIIAVYAVLQAVLPMTAYALALALPSILARRSKRR
jgi:putative thiamine transport system permease protein